MITMGMVDTSDLIMMITWAIDISFQTPKQKWACWTHTTPYIVTTKAIERTSSMLDTPLQDKLHQRLHIFNACEHSCTMVIMVGSKMLKTEYDVKAIMYPAYDILHKLCNIKGNWNIKQQRLPPNNVGRLMQTIICQQTFDAMHMSKKYFDYIHILWS